jgi:ferredoxin
VADGAIILGELGTARDLPFGWGVQLEAGRYRLQRRDDSAAFAHSAGPQSWKQFLHPAREKLWSARLSDGGFELDADEDGAAPRLAFVGVRPCDLRAIGIQDRVLGSGRGNSRYAARRAAGLIVAVNCTEPGETCFCTSMGTGPAAGPGYDLALTEVVTGERHEFVVDVGTQAGAAVLAGVPLAAAGASTLGAARDAVAGAAHRMVRSMPAAGLPELMSASYRAERWDDVASRCLTCGNCTMACPTCFCTSVEDVTDLDGDHAERWQHWASCFDLDFLLPAWRAGPGLRQQPVPAMAHPQAGHLARPVRQFRLCRLWAVHRLVPGRHRHHRGGRRTPGGSGCPGSKWRPGG